MLVGRANVSVQCAYCFGSSRHSLHGDFVASRRRLLLVEPDPTLRRTLEAVASPFADVDACSSFASARTSLKRRSYDLLVTPLRLREYNGLHLVYLAKGVNAAVRSIVY